MGLPAMSRTPKTSTVSPALAALAKMMVAVRRSVETVAPVR